ncbi:MAG: exo-alpha-sialidase [Bacteroidales bacterium]|nr:exo-alpha-sialidase [Bacteroidales bacterium]
MNDSEFISRSANTSEGRRKFLKHSLIGGISTLCMPLTVNSLLSEGKMVKYRLSLDTPARLFDEKRRSWVHPRAGIVPGAGIDGLPRVVMTMNLISGSDVFNNIYGLITNDLGKTWSSPEELAPLYPHFEEIDGVKKPVVVSDFWPRWHHGSKVLLGTGHTVVYGPDWKFTPGPRPRHTSYSVYNPDTNVWLPWHKLEVPEPGRFSDCGAGSTQRFDKPDGSVLLPVYFRPPGSGSLSTVTIVLCKFDGNKLQWMEHGDELSTDVPRGFGEPSLTYFQDKYFLTIRNDQKGFVTKGTDGLHFEKPRPWTFDDGNDLGNYNTQQHWVTHSDGLFLVYTRRGAFNDHVTRHRAPLFMAQVDPEKLCVIRDTESVLVPERGATLGNFGVTDISKNETWVTTAEVMLRPGTEKYGSDGSVFAARIHWRKPNGLFRI